MSEWLHHDSGAGRFQLTAADVLSSFSYSVNNVCNGEGDVDADGGFGFGFGHMGPDLSGLSEEEREQIEDVMRRDTIVRLYNELKVR